MPPLPELPSALRPFAVRVTFYQFAEFGGTRAVRCAQLPPA